MRILDEYGIMSNHEAVDYIMYTLDQVRAVNDDDEGETITTGRQTKVSASKRRDSMSLDPSTLQQARKQAKEETKRKVL